MGWNLTVPRPPMPNDLPLSYKWDGKLPEHISLTRLIVGESIKDSSLKENKSLFEIWAELRKETAGRERAVQADSPLGPTLQGTSTAAGVQD